MTRDEKVSAFINKFSVCQEKCLIGNGKPVVGTKFPNDYYERINKMETKKDVELKHHQQIKALLSANALLIGQSPGEGTDRTGVCFFGDRSGDLFEKFMEFYKLDCVSLSRDKFVMTNICLCAPKTEDSDFWQCLADRNHLPMILDIVKPKVIGVIGKVAASGLHYYLNKLGFECLKTPKFDKSLTLHNTVQVTREDNEWSSIELVYMVHLSGQACSASEEDKRIQFGSFIKALKL